ncbi:hypothetical protein DFJ74DRAFT_307700 [Hyaloraphidium curvatum]|nr:hypothetical protein DFJ74DRAFT_307700 [Hyaloraphidium curvatum]
MSSVPPPIPVDAPGRTAVILGGNGITGTYLVEHLLKTPEKDWTKIIAVSRKLPNKDWLRHDLGLDDAQIEQVAKGTGRLSWITADLLEESVESLKSKFAAGGVAAGTHCFWAAYINIDGTGMPKERVANAKMFEQGLRATVEIAGYSLRRVILQCGAKWYGPHKRSVPMPLKESMGPHTEGADFYLMQRDSMLRLAEEWKDRWDWVITLPGTVYGFTRASYQSLATSLALYAAMKAHLREPLEFPGTRQRLVNADDAICAALLAEFDVWCATTPACGGEVFNVMNADVFSWKFLWPMIVKEFGCVPPTRTGANMQGTPHSVEKDLAGRAAGVWRDMCAKYPGLDPSAADYATWWFVDFALAGNQMMLQSMIKARKFGWTGYRDTEAMLHDIFARMRKAGSLPPAPSVEEGSGSSKASL